MPEPQNDSISFTGSQFKAIPENVSVSEKGPSPDGRPSEEAIRIKYRAFSGEKTGLKPVMAVHENIATNMHQYHDPIPADASKAVINTVNMMAEEFKMVLEEAEEAIMLQQAFLHGGIEPSTGERVKKKPAPRQPEAGTKETNRAGENDNVAVDPYEKLTVSSLNLTPVGKYHAPHATMQQSSYWLKAFMSCADLVLGEVVRCFTEYGLNEIINHRLTVSVSDPFRCVDGCLPLHLACMMRRVDIAKLLLVHGADIDPVVNFGPPQPGLLHATTPMVIAVSSGNEVLTKLLIECGASLQPWVPSDNPRFPTLLHVAVCSSKDGLSPYPTDRGRVPDRLVATHIRSHDQDDYNRRNMAVYLIQKGLDVDSVDVGGRTPLYKAAASGYRSCSSAMIEYGADVNHRSRDGDTPLHAACLRGKENVIQLLLKHNANVHAENNKGLTPLHWAVQGQHLGAVTVLLQAGANVLTTGNDEGLTPLHIAAMHGMGRILDSMLLDGYRTEFGEPVDQEGRTPLYFAALHGHRNCCVVLARHFRNGFTRKFKGDENALHLASSSGHLSVVPVLASNGTDPRSTNINGRTPLHEAIDADYIECAMVVLELGYECVNMQDNQGNTPLHLAVRRGAVDLIKRLIELGADCSISNKGKELPIHVATKLDKGFCLGPLLDAMKDMPRCDTLLRKFDNSGRGCLHIAASSGFLRLVERFSKIMDPWYRDKLGNTALHHAAGNGFVQICRYLLNEDEDHPLPNIAEMRNSHMCNPFQVAVPKTAPLIHTVLQRYFPAVLHIEHCVNCDEHRYCTDHDEQKYHEVCEETIESIRRRYPNMQVSVNACKRPRLGSFEVWYRNTWAGVESTEPEEVFVDGIDVHLPPTSKIIVYSKLKRKVFPKSGDHVAQKLVSLLGCDDINDIMMEPRLDTLTEPLPEGDPDWMAYVDPPGKPAWRPTGVHVMWQSSGASPPKVKYELKTKRPEPYWKAWKNKSDFCIATDEGYSIPGTIPGDNDGARQSSSSPPRGRGYAPLRDKNPNLRVGRAGLSRGEEENLIKRFTEKYKEDHEEIMKMLMEEDDMRNRGPPKRVLSPERAKQVAERLYQNEKPYEYK